jgi:hypothetical protein
VPPRQLHYVGSLPAELTDQGPKAAMAWAISIDEYADEYDRSFDSVPCDIDTRWIIDYLDHLGADTREGHAFRTLRAGDSSNYDQMPIYRVAKGHKLNALDVSMDRYYKLVGVINAYRELRSETTDGALPPLQLSLPNPLDLALFVFCGKVDFKRHPIRTLRGAYLALRHLRKFITAAVNDTAKVQAFADNEVYSTDSGVPLPMDGSDAEVPIVWNLESPAVLYALNLVPRWMRPTLAKLLAKQVASFISTLWVPALWLHLCYGNLDDEQVIDPSSMDEVTMFLNPLEVELKAVGAKTPRTHIPAAFGHQPPPLDPAFYEGLARLSDSYDLVAGVVDENNPEASRKALTLFEEAAGRQAVAVATACGLGRHSMADATRASWVMKELSEMPAPAEPLL